MTRTTRVPADRGLPSGVPIAYSREYRRCGKASCRRCGPGNPGHGPYWVARWTADGRRHKRYLGTEPPPAVRTPTQDHAELEELHPLSPATAGDTSAIHVQVLGGFAVWRDGQRIPAEAWARRKAGALVKCLLAAPGFRLRRDEVIAYLWPHYRAGGDTRQAGQRSLRVSLHQARRLLDQPARHGADARASTIESLGDALVMAVRPRGQRGAPPLPPEEWLDSATFQRAAHRALQGGDAGACRAALALYGGAYLPDDPLLDADWGERWVEDQRRALRQLCHAVHARLAALYLAEGARGAAEEQVRAALRLEPTDKEMAVRLMRLLAADDRQDEAFSISQELGVASGRPAPAPRPDRTSGAARHLRANMPSGTTSFLGRVAEREAIRTALTTSRLITLTGRGGSGKTRLALAVAGDILSEYPDGVWLVDLTDIADPSLIPQAIAMTLGLRAEPGQPALAHLSISLRRRRPLLLLDNCEHVAAACARIAGQLLRDCPDLRILATSRDVLHAAGEVVYRVPPLALPDRAHLPPPDELATYDAIALFIERARARRAGVALTVETAPTIAAICARLDGLALAIELAAARVETLSLGAIMAQLGDSIDLLSNGPREVLPRHRALRAVLDWSHALLRPQQRVLLRRLAVFAGGWTQEAAVAVCADAEIPPHRVAALLDALVDHSLVRVDERSVPPRYSFDEMIRQYALAHLTASGERATLRDRHAAHVVAWADMIEPLLRGPEQMEWLARVEAERDNVRLVLAGGADASKEDEDAPDASSPGARALRVAAALWRFWEIRAPLHEGRYLVEGALARGHADRPAYPRARVVAGRLALAAGDDVAAHAHVTAALTLARARADDHTAAHALLGLGALALQRGEAAWAAGLFRESLALWRALDDRWGQAAALDGLGRAAHDRGWFEGVTGRGAAVESVVEPAVVLYEQSLAAWDEIGESWSKARTLLALGDAAMDREDYARATAWYDQSLDIAQALGDHAGQGSALFGLGMVAFAQQNIHLARVALEGSVASSKRVGAHRAHAMRLFYLGDCEDWDGRRERALAYYRESEGILRDLGDHAAIASMRTNYAFRALQAGDYDRAGGLARESIAALHALGNDVDIVFALYFLAVVAHEKGDDREAVQLHRRGLMLARDHFRGWYRRHGTIVHLRGLANALCARGHAEQASRLLGAADGLAQLVHRPLHPWERPAHERALARARDHLGSAVVTRLQAEGASRDLDQAIAYALTAIDAEGHA